MNNTAVLNENIKVLLHENSQSFKMLMDIGGCHNMDFADYVSRFSIHKFRSALQNPELSRAALAAMLRRAERTSKEKNTENCSDYWATFLARYVEKNANTNDRV